MQRKKAQVWVETVIYTLIALAMIGAVLAYVTPKIQEIQDKAIIDQSLDVMKTLDNQVVSVSTGEGNKRIVMVEIKKGELKIDGKNDKIIFEMPESKTQYSEPVEEDQEGVKIGDIEIKTVKVNKNYKVSLILDYSEREYDIQYNSEDKEGIISKSPSPYKMSIENTEEKINFKIIE